MIYLNIQNKEIADKIDAKYDIWVMKYYIEKTSPMINQAAKYMTYTDATRFGVGNEWLINTLKK